MPDIYIDAVKGPTLDSVAMKPGTHYYLQAGQTHDVSGYRFLGDGCTLDRFGEGANPIVRKTKGGDAWVYVRGSDVCIRNLTLDGSAFTGPVLAIVSQRADAPIVNVRLENLIVHGSPDHHGLYIAGLSGGTVRDVVIEDSQFLLNGWHGALVSSNVQRVTYRRCTARGNGHNKGAHGFSSWSDSPASAPAYIAYEGCLAEDTQDTSPRQIEGQGFQSDDYSSFVSFVGCVSRGNAGRGFYCNKSTSGVVRDCRSYQDRRGPMGASAASFTVDGSFVAYR